MPIESRPNYHPPTPETLLYDQGAVRYSERNARVMTEQYVAKWLLRYEDVWFHQGSLPERQEALCATLDHCRTFATVDYLRGLAPVDTEQGRIDLSRLVTNPNPEVLDPTAEYALIMDRLDDTGRVDRLLAAACGEEDVFATLNMAIESLAGIHNKLVMRQLYAAPESVTNGEAAKHANAAALEKKFMRNLGYPLHEANSWDGGAARAYIMQRFAEGGLSDTAHSRMIQEFQGLLAWQYLQKRIFASQYRADFNARCESPFIVRGHGDTHTQNVIIVNRVVEWIDAIAEPIKYKRCTGRSRHVYRRSSG